MLLQREKEKNEYERDREDFIGADNGKFSVDWFKVGEKKLSENVPIIIFVHGLNGGSGEPTIASLSISLTRKYGWRCCCIIFRGCSGTLVTTLRTYHGGYTEDLHIALTAVSKRYPNSPIALIGISLGGNVVTKYVGERNSEYQTLKKFKYQIDHEPIPLNVRCSVSICSPMDYVYVNTNLSKKLKQQMGKGMVYFLKKNKEVLSKLSKYDDYFKNPDYEYNVIDRTFTIQMFGYDDEVTAYDDNSGYRFIDGIGPHAEKDHCDPFPIHHLIINSRNDPFALFEGVKACIPPVEKNPNTLMIITPGGAHLGFFSPFSINKRFDHGIIIKFLKYKFFGEKEPNGKSL